VRLEAVDAAFGRCDSKTRRGEGYGVHTSVSGLQPEGEPSQVDEAAQSLSCAHDSVQYFVLSLVERRLHVPVHGQSAPVEHFLYAGAGHDPLLPELELLELLELLLPDDAVEHEEVFTSLLEQSSTRPPHVSTLVSLDPHAVPFLQVHWVEVLQHTVCPPTEHDVDVTSPVDGTTAWPQRQAPVDVVVAHVQVTLFLQEHELLELGHPLDAQQNVPG
jgi:hypothetical protein